MKRRIVENIKKYRFEFRHITVLFILLILFQIVISVIQKSSMHSFLRETQEWYQKESAEKIADLTTTPIELLIENINPKEIKNEAEAQKIIQSFNIILSQQLLQQHIEDVFLILIKTGNPLVIDDGKSLYSYLRDEEFEMNNKNHQNTLELFHTVSNDLKREEKIISLLKGEKTYHIFVPFVPNGEYLGVLYMKKTPDFSSITNKVIMSYNEVAIIYSSLIILGLLAMYYISSYSVKERNEAQQELFDKNEKHLKKEIRHQKESLFTKRIYHTHHKAEKIMGFIKEDLRQLNDKNAEEIKYRVTKYSNFISRVIYDMKWYDPPLQTIRNPIFRTDLNEVLQFLIQNTFLRISSATDIFEFKLDLDENLPIMHINEFVIWEMLEPLIQNSIDHSGVDKVLVEIKTKYNLDKKQSTIIISDNGNGISEELLEYTDDGVKLLFSENVTTKKDEKQNSGYGCYIAYQMAVKRCGWIMDVENLSGGGSMFKITINH